MLVHLLKLLVFQLMNEAKKDMIAQLRREILLLEGFKPAATSNAQLGLGPVEAAFPNGVFPTGAIHECISQTADQNAATAGFVAAIGGKLLKAGGTCIWISVGRKLFPPALQAFGIVPEQVLFFDLQTEQDAMWVTEEALKCTGLGIVVVEIRELDFNSSRRLQLAVEKSGVTGFILRHQPRKNDTTATVARWQIRQLSSVVDEALPGVGHPSWEIQLQKVRNGKPGCWQFQWVDGSFEQIKDKAAITPTINRRKTG